MRGAMTVQARLEEGFGVPHPVYASGVSDTLGRAAQTQSFAVRSFHRARHIVLYI
jgi:hypothetical protein